MRSLRKTAAVGLALAVLAAACGGSDDADGTPGDTSVDSGSTPADDTDTPDTQAPDSETDGTDADGTTAPDDGSEAATPNGDFVYSVELPVPGWDPHGEGRNAVMAYYQAPYDGLVNTAPDGSIVPALATEWDISETEAVFTLREGVTFHDGTPFDADAVKYNIEKVQGTPGANAIKLSAITDVQVVSDTEVVFVLDRSAPDLLTNLGLMAGLMLSPNVSPDDVAAGTPAGTGPYMIESFTEDRTLMVPFADFWDPSQQGLESVEYLSLPDDSARLNALSTGVADAVSLRPNQIEGAESAGLEVTEAVANVMGFVVNDVNGQTEPALGDERVRQALAHAIDRDAWTTAVNRGLGAPVFQIFADDSPFHVDDFDGFEYDPDRARELLAEAGVTDLVITTSGSGPFSVGAQVLQQLFADVGVTLEIVEVPPGGDIAAVQAFEVLAGQAPTPDSHPEQVYARFFAPMAASNPTGATVDGFEEARQAALAAGDDDASAEGYREMMRIAYESAWYVPIHTNPSLIGFDAEEYPGLTALDRRVLGVNLRELTAAG